MTLIKPSEAFKTGADWQSAEVRAYVRDQLATHVDVVADIRDNDLEQTRFVYVRSAAALYRLNLSSGAADDGDTVIHDNLGRRYEKVIGAGGIGSSNGTVTNIIKLTQAEYDLLDPADPTTFYIIVDE